MIKPGVTQYSLLSLDMDLILSNQELLIKGPFKEIFFGNGENFKKSFRYAQVHLVLGLIMISSCRYPFWDIIEIY